MRDIDSQKRKMKFYVSWERGIRDRRIGTYPANRISDVIEDSSWYYC
jgi:hypothetical protein